MGMYVFVDAVAHAGAMRIWGATQIYIYKYVVYQEPVVRLYMYLPDLLATRGWRRQGDLKSCLYPYAVLSPARRTDIATLTAGLAGLGIRGLGLS